MRREHAQGAAFADERPLCAVASMRVIKSSAGGLCPNLRWTYRLVSALPRVICHSPLSDVTLL